MRATVFSVVAAIMFTAAVQANPVTFHFAGTLSGTSNFNSLSFDHAPVVGEFSFNPDENAASAGTGLVYSAVDQISLTIGGAPLVIPNPGGNNNIFIYNNVSGGDEWLLSHPAIPWNGQSQFDGQVLSNLSGFDLSVVGPQTMLPSDALPDEASFFANATSASLTIVMVVNSSDDLTLTGPITLLTPEPTAALIWCGAGLLLVLLLRRTRGAEGLSEI